LGYESVWIPETWGFDAVSVLAALAVHTSRIRLASGVVNVYSRSPTLIAQTAATLQDLSQNRFILGLGVSGPAVVERWHGTPFFRPLERTRAAVEIIRLALSGRRVEYHAAGFDLSGFSLAAPPAEPIPLFIAAIGPRNVHLVGEIADGWLPIFAARGHISRTFEQFQRGAQSAGRDPSSLDVAAFIPFLFGPRGDDLLRRQLAYYVGGMGTFYASFLERLGFRDEVATIRTAWDAGDRRSAVHAVAREMLDACTLGSSEHAARERIKQLQAEGIRMPVLTFPHGATESEIRQSIEIVAPEHGM
jgi:F420-dependent oxidoreductase-like protein